MRLVVLACLATDCCLLATADTAAAAAVARRALTPAMLGVQANSANFTLLQRHGMWEFYLGGEQEPSPFSFSPMIYFIETDPLEVPTRELIE